MGNVCSVIMKNEMNNDKISQKAPNFEILREMESFTEDMFNRIIAFQEKEHPVWNTQLPFEERIKGLPLHFLVFSNPDRNPQTQGPTVSHFYPLKEEMIKICHYAKQVSNNPVIYDMHARNGFIGSLLAREGKDQLRVIGNQQAEDKPNQIENLMDENCYSLKNTADGTNNAINYDVAFSSWMPSGENATADMIKDKPKLIVLIYTNHTDPVTGIRQTGTDGAFTDLPANYKLIDKWTIDRPKDLFHEVWPDLTPSPEEKRHVRIYADQPWHEIDIYKTTSPFEPYDWEKELQMATLALQAKQSLRERGFPVQ